MSLSRLLLIAGVGTLVLVLFVPSIRGGLSRTLTSFTSSNETIIVPSGPDSLTELTEGREGQALELVTLLGFDAIPAILDPQFVTAEYAAGQLKPDELVLGLSINGDVRAYYIPMLSAHEIVNDVVGGVPVAITW